MDKLFGTGSRDRLLDGGGEFSVTELKEFGLASPLPSGGRTLLLVPEKFPARLVPDDLMHSLRASYSKNKDDKFFLQSLHSAFFIYRECVNQDIGAVFARYGEIWEWPTPALFSWKDLDAINFLGMAMGSFDRTDSVRVSVKEGDREIIRDLSTGQITQKDVAGIANSPSKNLKFEVQRLSDVRMINSQSWQSLMLNIFATSVMRAIDAIESDRGKVDPQIHQFVLQLSERLPGQISFPGVRYAKSGERSDASALLFGF